MAATLTGPITLPDGTPVVGALIKVRLVAGNARAMGHVNGNTVAGVATATTDEDGNFTINVDALADNDTDVYPSGAYYEVEVGGGRFPKYTRKVKPEEDLTYQLGDPDIFGESEDLLPPEFVQAVPDFLTEDIQQAVIDYLTANPIDVEDEVDAALASDPPLLVSENGADVDDPATFRLNIGAASDSDTAASIATVQNSIDALNLAEATSPAVRAPGYDSVTFAVDEDGVISFEVNGAGGGGGGGSFQPLDSDLTAIAALTTTSFGRALLTLANAAALRSTIGPSGTPDSSTYLRGDGTWDTPAGGGGGSVATDAIWDAAGDLAVGSGANTAAKLTKGSASTFLRVNSGGTALEWAGIVDGDLPAGLARDAEVAAGYQPLDSDLTAIAALTTTTIGRSLLAAADAAALRTILALGTAATSASGDFQPIDADLTAIAALTTTSIGRSLLAAADAAAIRTISGAAPLASPTFTGTPAAPTAGSGTNTTQIATTAFVQDAVTAGGGYTAENARDDIGAALTEGAGIDITVNDGADTITVASTITQYTDEMARDALGTALTAGTGITVTPNDGADTITIAGTVTQYTDEMAQDAVGSILADSSSIDFTYTDATPEITAVVKPTSITNAMVADDAIGIDELSATGTADNTTYLRGDNTWATPAGGGAIATDTLWDTAGDLALGTGANTATKLVVGTEGGLALTADPHATNKASWSQPMAVYDRFAGSTNSLASTYDRSAVVEGNPSALTSQRLNMVRILLPKGMTITSITFWSATTAAGTPLNQWFGLFDSSRVPLRLTVDDTTTAWTANTAKTLNLSSTFQTTYAGWYYLGIMVRATTVPTISGAVNLGVSNIRNAAPVPSGTSSTGLTDPASCPNPAGAITGVANMLYAEVA